MDLVPTCNDSLLTHFFDHEDEEDTTSFYLLTVSDVILDCVSNRKLNHINKKKKLSTTTVVVLLITTSPVTTITKDNTDHTNPVPILASNQSESTTTSTDHTKKCPAHSNSTPIQVKYPTLYIYYPYTDKKICIQHGHAYSL